MSSEGSKEIDDAPRRLASIVYEFLRSRQFSNDLYWDTLSDLKDKSIFKRAREYLNLLTSQVEEIPNFADDKIAIEPKKNIVAEICSVAYAIDTVFSKILFMRLEKEYKSGIHEALKKLKDEGKISDDVLAAFQIISSLSIEDSNENKEINSKASTSGQVKEKQNSSNEDKIMENDKLGTRKSTRLSEKTPQKYVAPAPQSETGTLHPGGEKSSAPPISENMYNATQKDMENIFSSTIWDDSEDSDTSSNISFGEKSVSSVSSVSSVHTSDLSSFDDEFSVSDEDGTKIKFSFKKLMAHINIKVSPKLEDELNETKLKTSSNSSKKNDAEINYTLEIKEKSPSNSQNGESTPPENILDKLSESSHSPTSSTTSVISTKRVRKPNSKYASEDMVCMAVKIKERKKQNVDYAINEEKEMSNPISPKKKRTRNESSDVEVETPSKVQKKGIKKPTASDGKSPEKTNETPDSKKPQACIRSLTSRRTAPVTLFSTA